MLRRMGFERKMMRGVLCAVLLLTGTAAVAAPEPLIITKLPAQELVVTQSALVEQGSSMDEAIQKLGQSLGQAITLERQAIQTACASARRPKPGTPAAYDWRARCSYQRY
jgi:hypothetical protein